MKRDTPTDVRARKASAPSCGSTRADSPRVRTLQARGRDLDVEFTLERTAGGLYVECAQSPRRGLPIVEAILFDDADRFRQWCDADALRFEHPLLHVSLKRDGDELFATDPEATQG